jgi:hypothetical protein
MKIKIIFPGIVIFIFFYACSPSLKITTVNTINNIDTILPIINDTTAIKPPPIIDHSRNDPFLLKLLEAYPQYFDSILENRKIWNVQIIYTQVNRDRNNKPHFKDYYFNVDSTQYFYPASTVKLPAVLLALQKLNELRNTGISRNTTMITGADYSGQTVTYNDPQTIDGRPTIESYIKRILLVSDNEAFNRLYEFLGQQYINDQLHEKGYLDAQIIHRLEISLSEDENRHTNPVKFLDSNNNVLYSQPLSYNQEVYAKRHDSLGKAYFNGSRIIDTPMDFSHKNRLSLHDLHQILRSVIFPKAVKENQRFNITDSDYNFLHKYMSEFPSESIYPSYDSSEFPDAYVKFLLYGARNEPLPKSIRIFNKVGDAYGELVDVAYITDLEKNIEFFVSAAINCNTNGVVNDNNYEYDSLGFPFIKNLGKVLYDYELGRKRSYPPDLSSFRILYDK